MKRFFCVFTLMLLAVVVVADYQDPNESFDSDSDSNGVESASAFASEYRGDTYEYYASGSGYYSGNGGCYFSVAATVAGFQVSDAFGAWGPNSAYISNSGSFSNESYANGYGSAGYSQASASI